MARITYTDPDGGTAWFEESKATLVSEQETFWDGSNRISRATGSQWADETLYRTARGAWVVCHNNRDGRRGAVLGETWRGLTPVDAEQWLRKQGLHEIADAEFEAVEERGPGRPEIGGKAHIAYGTDLLARIDAAAETEGITRAEWVRRACEEALCRQQASN